MKISEDRIIWIINQTMRSKNQTLFLLNLLDNDFEKLKDLEENIKNMNLNYCPGSKEEIVKILKMKPSNEWFFLEKEDK
jgi:hypothetical protein